MAIGRMFFGESMLARRTDASKVALVHLVRQLQRWDFRLMDCQMSTDHLASLGAREIPREDFVDEVNRSFAGNRCADGGRRTKTSPKASEYNEDEVDLDFK